MVAASSNHYMRSDEITSYQREKIEELRSRIADELVETPEYGDDFSLMRWLLGWDFDIGTR